MTGQLLAEDVGLSEFPLPLRSGAVFDCLVEDRHQLGASGAGGIKGSRLDQAFEHALIHFVEINPPAELEE